ncbi:MAG TPA: hypothetical protein ENK22_11060 [Persephonella sp.]|nr:hypothetical protein [Persephonella sp.]
MYELAKLIHLIGAVVFGGVVFTEVVLLPALKEKFGEKEFRNIEKIIIQKRGIKIVPLFVLLLYISGLYMFHFHAKNLDLSTNFGKLLITKVSFAFVVLMLVLTAIFLFVRGKSESKLFEYAHYGVFVFVFFIIILAKLMFIL